MDRTPQVSEAEVEFSPIRAQGSGGQNVNKVSSAMHLRFDIHASSLSDPVKERLSQMKDSRISDAGIIVIKAQRFRTQEKNRRDALDRLQALIDEASHVPTQRKPTRPTLASRQRRLDHKARASRTKLLRRKVTE